MKHDKPLMKLLGMFAASMGFCASVLAQSGGNWTQFWNDQKGNDYSFNMERIKRDSSGAYTAWWRSKTKTPAVVYGKTYTSVIALYRVSCDMQTLARLQIYFYDGKQFVVYSETLPQLAEQVVPDSLGDRFLTEVCSMVRLQGL